ncbi:hypothetical protein L9F63_024656 [Diploptera punctata]|uniref:G-protein coupled receptors family 1 profile domain-containing protein n=1 Tax=Diploptera punctata TaxID=6984 RepID=A0AAD7ZF86_DIPPU|nr:hypothetical protein L9F63_024656 [Diploptera punctata]
MLLAVLMCYVALVWGECPSTCQCSRYNTLCSFARLNTVPSGLPNTTQLVRVHQDHIPLLNKSIISHLHNITCLQLDQVRLQRIEPETFSMFSNLQSLTIIRNNLTTLHAHTFTHLPNLHLLNLSNNEIHVLKSESFFGLDSLRHLDMSLNSLTIENNAFALTRTQKCDFIKTPRKLDLHSNAVLEIELESFKNLCMFTHVDLGLINLRNLMRDVFLGFTNVTHLHVHVVHDSLFGLRLRTGFLNGLSSLVNLIMNGGDITSINAFSFRNLTLVRYLDLRYNRIYKLQTAAFFGLRSLKILKLDLNPLNSIHGDTFFGLRSLEILTLVDCQINILESNAFRGVLNLRVLDLSKNYILTFGDNIFSNLYEVRELRIGYISLFNKPSVFENVNSVKYLSRYSVPNGVPENLSRIDSVGLVGPFKPIQNIQVLRTLNFDIYAEFDDPKQSMSDVLESIRYIKEITLQISHLNSTEIFHVLQYSLSSVTVVSSNFGELSYKNAFHLPNINTFKLGNSNITEIQKGAFQEADLLTVLVLNHNYGFRIKSQAFDGIYNLKTLSLWNNKIQEINDKAFLGLQNLELLDLSENNISFLSPQIFHGLKSIKTINLYNNTLRSINASVFGSICKKDFKLSCKNATSYEYCDPDTALTTLEFLDLGNNNITYIDPHAFIFCLNLRTLYLNENRLFSLTNSFLYTPNLQNLYIYACNVTVVPNNTFVCTPELTYIDLGDNTIRNLSVTPFLHLRKLKEINIFYNYLICNCELYNTWVWFNKYNIDYNPDNTHFYPTPLLCDNKSIETVLFNLKCHKTHVYSNQDKNVAAENDFRIFKQYIEPIILIIILILGLLCNGFLLYISLRYSEMRTKQNTCIIHLSLVDIINLLLNLMLSYWDVLNISWELGETTCKIFITSKDILVGATVFSVVSLSLERAIAARSFINLKNSCVSDIQPTTWFILMIWVSSIVISLPAYFFSTVRLRCLSNAEYIRRVWLFQLMVYCILPTITVISCNIMTWFFLRESIRKMPGEIKNNIRTKNRKIVGNTVLILALLFIATYSPSFILRVLVSLSIVSIDNIFLVSFFTYCLFFCNSIINPISIFVMSSKYKSHAVSYFKFFTKETSSRGKPVHLNARRQVTAFQGNFNRNASQSIYIDRAKMLQQARERMFSCQQYDNFS